MSFAGRFSGRTAIITGGVSGLGREVAHRLVAEGGSVALAVHAALTGSFAAETADKAAISDSASPRRTREPEPRPARASYPERRGPSRARSHRRQHRSMVPPYPA